MLDARQVQIGKLVLGNDRPFTLIAGPCQIESRQHALDMALALKQASAASAWTKVSRFWPRCARPWAARC